MQRKGVAGSWVLLWWLFWYGTSSGTGSWVLLWWLLWYLSVLVGRVVVSLGAGGWWEQWVTSVVMGLPGGLGSLTALSSGICLLAASEAPWPVECCGPLMSWLCAWRLPSAGGWAKWLPGPGRLESPSSSGDGFWCLMSGALLARGGSPVVPTGFLPVWVTSPLQWGGVSVGMPLGVLPAWAPASDEELALSVGSVCSACMEQPPGRRWVSHVLAFQRTGIKQ